MQISYKEMFIKNNKHITVTLLISYVYDNDSR